MRALLPTLWLLGCRDAADPRTVPAPCALAVNSDGSSHDAIRTESTCGGLVLDQLEVVGTGEVSWEIFVDATQLVIQLTAETDAVVEAFHARGTWWAEGDRPAVLWRQGYQSWSPSGVFSLAAVEVDDRGLPIAGGDGGATSVVDETVTSSWWGAAVGRPDGGAVALGVLSARSTKFVASFDEGGAAHAVWGGRGEAIALEAGQTRFLDPLWLATGPDANALLRGWAESVASGAVPPPLGDLPPTGWSTWYQYYDRVTEDDVRANLARAAELRDRRELAPLEVFQIDDGWSVRWGEWTHNERFPSGMAALAAEIDAAGFTPGVWMAPFYVDRAAPAYVAHPDWWVRGFDGAELSFGDRAVIDATHPQALRWMVEQVADRVDEGYRYLKLDFLYAGAEEGLRREDVTGVDAYQRAMRAIRGAVGDTWILACGAPLLPTVGWAQSYRSGPDIAFEVSPDPDPAFLRNQARSSFARGWSNGVWWWVDPDAILLRAPFDEDQARGAVVANAVSGGVWMLGDDLVALDEARVGWGLGAEAVATRGGWGVPRDPLALPSGFDASPLVEHAQQDDRVPTTWDLPGGVVALLNLGVEPVELDGPGGTELLTGEAAEPGKRTLAPGEGELWSPLQAPRTHRASVSR